MDKNEENDKIKWIFFLARNELIYGRKHDIILRKQEHVV